MARTKGSISRPRVIDPEELREILKPIYDKLAKAGVPEARLPSNEALVSHLLGWVDRDKIDAWIKDFAKLES